MSPIRSPRETGDEVPDLQLRLLEAVRLDVLRLHAERDVEGDEEIHPLLLHLLHPRADLRIRQAQHQEDQHGEQGSGPGGSVLAGLASSEQLPSMAGVPEPLRGASVCAGRRTRRRPRAHGTSSEQVEVFGMGEPDHRVLLTAASSGSSRSQEFSKHRQQSQPRPGVEELGVRPVGLHLDAGLFQLVDLRVDLLERPVVRRAEVLPVR